MCVRAHSRKDAQTGQAPAEGRARKQARTGGPAHERAPVEGQAEEELRVGHAALHERVRHHQRHRGGAQQDGVVVELEQDAQPRQELRTEKGDTCGGRGGHMGVPCRAVRCGE